MAATRVANVVTLNAADDTLKDLYAMNDIAGMSFKRMVVSGGAAGSVVFETDRGADTTFWTLNMGVGAVVIDGPINFVDGFKIGVVTTITNLQVQLFL